MEKITLEEFIKRHDANANLCDDLNVMQFASDSKGCIVSFKGRSEMIVGSIVQSLKFNNDVKAMVMAAIDTYKYGEDKRAKMSEDERANLEIEEFLLNKEITSMFNSRGIDTSLRPVKDAMAIFWDSPTNAMMSVFDRVEDDKFVAKNGLKFEFCVRFTSTYQYLSIINESEHGG